jgi:hypothetical protein
VRRRRETPVVDRRPLRRHGYPGREREPHHYI